MSLFDKKLVEIIFISWYNHKNKNKEFAMTDFHKTIIKYILIIIIIYVSFTFLLPYLVDVLKIALDFLLKVVMWGLIIFVIYLLGNFIYQSYKNND